jgi:phosphoglycerate dehydrogenase-like enzyme
MRLVYWPRFPLARAQIIDGLTALPGVQLTVAESLDAFIAALPGAEGLVLPDAPLPMARQVSAALKDPRCQPRWVHLISAGREGLETAGLPPGTVVSTAAGANAATVAEHAMALALALGRQIPAAVRAQEGGRWDGGLSARARSLEGARLLIVGMGHIGRALAPRALAFGMTVEAVTRRPEPHPTLQGVYPLDRLRDRAAEADLLVAALALTPQTTRIVDASVLDACRPDALLVNVGRGALIDQDALLTALTSGRLGGAALDVTDPEPLPEGHPLWRCPRLLVTPHFAGGGSRATAERVAAGVIENCRRLIRGEPLQDTVVMPTVR